MLDGTVTRDHLAREVTGEERVGWWEHSVEAYLPYVEHQQKTDRQVPVLVVEPQG